MGSKVNPRSFRQTTTYSVPSRWFASRQQYARNLQKDVELRKFISKKFRDAGIALIEIERSLGEVRIIIFTSKPGVVIGRGGVLIEELKQTIRRQFFGSEKMNVQISIQEVQNPETNAELIFQSIRDQLEQRVKFRRALKRSLEQVIRAGAKGCKLQVSGRLNGAEIARTESVSEGRLPLHTLRADIDYSRGVAQTVYGVIGIKVWIYKGDVFGEEEKEEQTKKKTARPTQRKRLDTGGKKLILRKKSDLDKEKTSPAPQPQEQVTEEQ